MYKKLIKIFIWNNISNFLLIIFAISLSLTWFLVSDNLAINVQNLIWNDAKPLLWWDIKIESTQELNKEQLNYLENLEKEKKIILSTKIQTYSTITNNENNPDLVSLLFIDKKYPLYWEFDVIDKTKWVFVTQNIQDLFVKNNQIEVYWKVYNIWWIINKIPDSWLNLFDDWKKIVLELQEFNKLNLDKLWARINRDYLIKVNNSNDFEKILWDIKESELFSSLRINDYTKWWDMFSNIFSELNKFIKYIFIISFILTILILFLSVESFYLSNKKEFSILRILGLKNINLIYFNVFLFLLISIICLLITVLVSEIIFYIIRTFELSKDFYIDKISILKTSVLWIMILWLSVTLPLFKFLSNNPLTWLKENFLQIFSKKEIFMEILLILIGIILIYLLIIWDLLSAIFFTFILFISIFTISIIIKYILNYIYWKSRFLKNKNFTIYDSIRNTIKPWNLSILISFGYIISFTSLLFISIISLNFLDKINIDLNNNNNIYVININENDIENIDSKYKEESYSIILWRILSINDIDLKDHIWESWESRRFTREFNITDNDLENIKILKWNKIKSWEVSVDDDFAKSLNLKIWDRIKFFIYWIEKTLIVSNIRQSVQTSIQPFFYFQVYKEDFSNFPKKYFLSTFIPPSEIKKFKNDFLEKTWNNISFIELDLILKDVKSISKKVFVIIQVLFIYIFVFCTISLIVSILFLIPFKKKKSKLYKTLWASEIFIKKNNLFEYIYLQSLSFIISIIISTSFSYYLLDKSNFIDFWLGSYILSILFLFLVFIFLFILIKILVWNVSKN